MTTTKIFQLLNLLASLSRATLRGSQSCKYLECMKMDENAELVHLYTYYRCFQNEPSHPSYLTEGSSAN